MQRLLIYIGLLVIGDAIVYGIATAGTRWTPSHSLTIFLISYFLMLAITWVLAARLSKPKNA